MSRRVAVSNSFTPEEVRLLAHLLTQATIARRQEAVVARHPVFAQVARKVFTMRDRCDVLEREAILQDAAE